MRFIAFLLFVPLLAVTVIGFPGPVVDKKSAISELLKPRAESATAQTCGPVTGANVTGTCLNIDTTCCNGFYTADFCPGTLPNVQCCTEVQRCHDNSGYCNDVNHVSCSVPYVHNLCPGPSNVQCCRGVSGAAFCSVGH